MLRQCLSKVDIQLGSAHEKYGAWTRSNWLFLVGTFNNYQLEVIIYYGSAFVTYGNDIESEGVQFPGRDAPDRVNGGG